MEESQTSTSSLEQARNGSSDARAVLVTMSSGGSAADTSAELSDSRRSSARDVSERENSGEQGIGHSDADEADEDTGVDNSVVPSMPSRSGGRRTGRGGGSVNGGSAGGKRSRYRYTESEVQRSLTFLDGPLETHDAVDNAESGPLTGRRSRASSRGRTGGGRSVRSSRTMGSTRSVGRSESGALLRAQTSAYSNKLARALDMLQKEKEKQRSKFHRGRRSAAAGKENESDPEGSGASSASDGEGSRKESMSVASDITTDSMMRSSRLRASDLDSIGRRGGRLRLSQCQRAMLTLMTETRPARAGRPGMGEGDQRRGSDGVDGGGNGNDDEDDDDDDDADEYSDDEDQTQASGEEDQKRQRAGVSRARIDELAGQHTHEARKAPRPPQRRIRGYSGKLPSVLVPLAVPFEAETPGPELPGFVRLTAEDGREAWVHEAVADKFREYGKLYLIDERRRAKAAQHRFRTRLYGRLEDAKQCTFKPVVHRNPFAESTVSAEEANAKDSAERFLLRQEGAETLKKRTMEYKQGQLDYEARVDKRTCPSCGNQQAYDEVLEKKKLCTNCKQPYTYGITWDRVRDRFWERQQHCIESKERARQELVAEQDKLFSGKSRRKKVRDPAEQAERDRRKARRERKRARRLRKEQRARAGHTGDGNQSDANSSLSSASGSSSSSGEETSSDEETVYWHEVEEDFLNRLELDNIAKKERLEALQQKQHEEMEAKAAALQETLRRAGEMLNGDMAELTFMERMEMDLSKRKKRLARADAIEKGEVDPEWQGGLEEEGEGLAGAAFEDGEEGGAGW